MGIFSKIKKKLDHAFIPKEVKALVRKVAPKELRGVLGLNPSSPGGGGGGVAPPPAATNPFAQFSQIPGIGYAQQPGGPNPFAGVMSQIDPRMLQNPQAMALMQQILGGGGQFNRTPQDAAFGGYQAAPQQAPQGPANPFAGVPMGMSNPRQPISVPGRWDYTSSTPGPEPTQQTQMGRVGGLGNGGGKMTIPGAPRNGPAFGRLRPAK